MKCHTPSVFEVRVSGRLFVVDNALALLEIGKAVLRNVLRSFWKLRRTLTPSSNKILLINNYP